MSAERVKDYIAHIPNLKGNQSWLKAFAQRAATTTLLPLELRKAWRLRHGDRPLRLHLGCGDAYLPGWINIDLARPGRRQDLSWDLRRGLPFPDGAAEAIFSEHLFEHLSLASGLRLLEECRRVLAPKGVLRIGVPDLDRYVSSYLGDDPLIDDYRPGRPTRGLAFGEIFFFYGHYSMYDFETLELILRAAGFTIVEHSKFGEGRLVPSPDSQERRPETLYVEEVK